jgi:hypothetical protein
MRTLRDVNHALLDDLPRHLRYQRHWFIVGRLLMTAASTKTRLSVMLATDALVTALDAEGWRTLNPRTQPTNNQKLAPTAPLPAHINIGDSYNDLGATITGPTQADTNLGLHLYLDEAAAPSITIDTSEPGEHTINYVATNAAGTSTSTRTVIIELPTVEAPPTQPTPPSATTSPATTTASTTAPTSTPAQ